MTTVDAPAQIGRRGGSIGRLLALAAPLLVVGLAALLALVSDRMLYIGPLDRATFGWLVVVPLWAAAPFAAGIAWRNLAARARVAAAWICAFAIGTPLAVLLWQAAAFPGCQFGSARTPIEWLVPAFILGAVVGGGFGIASLVATREVRSGHPWRALLLGAIGQGFLVLAGSVLTFSLFFGVCQRPPAG